MIGRKSIAKISLTLKNLIKAGESENLEFKLKVDEDLGKTICAFANTNDGSILIGINNKGNVMGCYKKDEEKIANIASSCIPAVRVNIEKIKVNSKTILKVDVQKSKEIHSYRNIVYKRVGSTNRALTPQEVVSLAQKLGKVYWDSLVCEEASLKDIDKKKVMWYLERREKIRKIPKQLNIKTLLINIGAAKEIDKKIKPTNAGILFFGKNPQRFIPTRIIGARFRGAELSRTTIDAIDCDGTLPEMVEQAENFIRKNIKLFGFRTEFTFRRIDKLEYPMEAVREAIINALIHRDYSELTDARLFIFDDRIEIINPGPFPEGVSPEKPVHKPRNLILCQLMRDIGFIEKFGSGIYFMKNLCREWGVQEPEFIIGEIETRVIFRSAGKGILVPEIKALGVGLNERQVKALQYALESGFITNSIYRKLGQVGKKTAYLELSYLVEKGLLLPTGKGRSVKYVARF